MNKFLVIGAGLGLLSVVMGASADHALSLTPEQGQSMDTAIRYNMLYAVLLSILALLPARNKVQSIAASFFALGTVVFCGSIYAALVTAVPQITYLTPVGGITLMAGWAALIVSGIRRPVS